MQGTKFIHFRVMEDGEYGGSNTPSARGGVTICYNPELRRIGIAVCSPEDNYCKKIGREISEGRMCNKHPEYSIDASDLEFKSYKDLVDSMYDTANSLYYNTVRKKIDRMTPRWLSDHIIVESEVATVHYLDN